MKRFNLRRMCVLTVSFAAARNAQANTSLYNLPWRSASIAELRHENPVFYFANDIRLSSPVPLS